MRHLLVPMIVPFVLTGCGGGGNPQSFPYANLQVNENVPVSQLATRPSENSSVTYAEHSPHKRIPNERTVYLAVGMLPVSEAEAANRVPSNIEEYVPPDLNPYQVRSGFGFNVHDSEGPSSWLLDHRVGAERLTHEDGTVVYRGKGVGVVSEQRGTLMESRPFTYIPVISVNFASSGSTLSHTAENIEAEDLDGIIESENGGDIGLPESSDLRYDVGLSEEGGELNGGFGDQTISGHITDNYISGTIIDLPIWNDDQPSRPNAREWWVSFVAKSGE